MPYLAYDALTEEEKMHFQRIRSEYSEADVQKIYQRFQQDPSRDGAFDRAIRNSLGDKMTREVSEIGRAFREPRRIADATHEFFAGQSGDPGRISALDIGKGLGVIGWSSITAPGQILGQWASGEESDTPIQDVVALGQFLPIGRGFAGMSALSARSAAKGMLKRGVSSADDLARVQQLGGLSQKLGQFTQNPYVKWGSRGAEAADIIAAGDEAGIEAIGEGMVEIPGSLGRLANRPLSEQRQDPLDEQADADAAAESEEHDAMTGSATAGWRAEDWERIMGGNEGLNLEESTQATRQYQQAIETPRGEAAVADAQARTEAHTARQQEMAASDAVADKASFTRLYQDFYNDMAGGQTSEAMNRLNHEYEVGVRDPIRERYDQIADGLQPQMGVSPSLLHEEAEKRLRLSIGEKWYKYYRGGGHPTIDPQPTPAQRVQEMTQKADAIVKQSVAEVEVTPDEPTIPETAPPVVEAPVAPQEQEYYGERRATEQLDDTETDAEKVKNQPFNNESHQQDVYGSEYENATQNQPPVTEIEKQLYQKSLNVQNAAQIYRAKRNELGEDHPDTIEARENWGKAHDEFKQFLSEVGEGTHHTGVGLFLYGNTDNATAVDASVSGWAKIKARYETVKNAVIQDVQGQGIQTQTAPEGEPAAPPAAEGEASVMIGGEEYTGAELEEQIGNVSNNLTEYIISEGDASEGVAETVEQSFSESVNEGIISEEDAQTLYPRVLARVNELLPEMQAEAEAIAQKEADVKGQVDEAIPNIKYTKDQVSLQTNDGVSDFDGYTVENTGIDYADIFIFKHRGGWSAIEKQTMKSIVANNATFKTREETVRAAMGNVLFTGEVDYRVGVLGQQESEPEVTPEPEAPAAPQTPQEKALSKIERMRANRQTTEAAPEPTPEPETPAAPAAPAAPQTPQEKALSKIERMRANRQKRESETLSDITPEQREMRNEYLELTVADEIAALEAMGDLDDFQTDVLAALNNPESQEAQDLRSEYLDLTLTDEIEALEAMGELDDFQTDVLDALKAAQAPEAETPAETPVTPESNAILGSLEDTPPMRVARWVSEKIKNQEPFTREELIQVSNSEWGGSFGEGAYELQEAFDAVEVGGNLALSEAEPDAGGGSFRPDNNLRMLNATRPVARMFIEHIRKIENDILPTPSRRDLEKIRAQQFSTPWHYAYLANWVANLQQNDVVLEPSAGTGNLAWSARRSGIEVHVNEVADRRLRILREQGFQNISNVDARQLANLLSAEKPGFEPTVVVMNPPFSSNVQTGAKSEMIGANMVSEALKTLAPGGRLVAITSGGSPAFEDSVGMAFNGSQQVQDWWARTHRDYSVRANIHVSGEDYKKFGTEFDSRLLVIDKPLEGESPSTDPAVTERVEHVSEMPALLEGVRDARILMEQTPIEPEGEGTADATGERGRDRGTQPGSPVRDTVGGVGDQQPTGISAEDSDTVAATPTEEYPAERPDGTDRGPADEPVTEGGDGVSAGDTVGRVGRGETDGGGLPETDRAGRGSSRDTGESDGTDAVVVERARLEASEGTYTPIAENHIEGTPLVMPSMLAAVPSPDVSNIELNVPNPSELSEAQTVATKRILRAHEYFKGNETDPNLQVREGYYNGWGTGGGKTRIFGSVILHNMAAGRNKAIVLTETKDLVPKFKDDYKALGGDEKKVYLHGNTKFGEKIKAGTGVIVSPYSTLRGAGTGSKNAEPWGRLAQLLEWAVGEKPPASLLGGASVSVSGDLPTLPMDISDAASQRQDFVEVPALYTLLGNYARDVDRYATVRQLDKHTTNYNEMRDQLEALRMQDQQEQRLSPDEWRQRAREFDGVLVMDEAHNAKNAIGDKAAKQALAVLMIQRMLPNARVAYMSATGTVTLQDAGYLERVGLFGVGTPFASFENMVSTLGTKTALGELAISSLKERGQFDAATLSYDGVDYDQVVHEMTDREVEAYGKIADIWRTLLLHIREYEDRYEEIAEEADAGGIGTVKANTQSSYYGANQRFWISYMMAIQLRSTIPHAIERIKEGDKVVFSLVNTSDSSQDRAVAKARSEGKAVEEFPIDLSEPLLQFLNRSFPTNMLQPHQTESGKATMGPVVRGGVVVPDQEMLQIKEEMLRAVNDLDMPENPLNMIVQKFRDEGLQIAEVTGRKERFIWVENEEGESKRVSEGKLVTRQGKDIQRFLDGDLNALVYSGKGATGRDYHSLPGQPRHHLYVVQVGWSPLKLEQSIGRVHRTGQSQPPMIYLARTDAPGEVRVMSSAAARLKFMGATSSGSAEATGGGSLIDDELAEYMQDDMGKQAFTNILSRLFENRHSQEGGFIEVPEMEVESMDDDGNVVVDTERLNFARVTSLLDLPVSLQDGAFTQKSIDKPMKTYLNRIMNMPVPYQNAIADVFFRELADLVAQAREDGTLDRGAEVMNTTEAVVARNTVLDTDPQSGAQTRLMEIDVAIPVRKVRVQEMDRIIARAPREGTGQFMRFITLPNGNLVAMFRSSSQVEKDQVIRRIKMMGVDRTSYAVETEPRIRNAKNEGTEFTEELQARWQAQETETPDTTQDKAFLATGQLIQNWNRLSIRDSEADTQSDVAESVQIQRVMLSDGGQVLGRRIPESGVEGVLNRFGATVGETTGESLPEQPVPEQPQYTPASLMAAVMDGENVRLQNGWELASVTRDGEPLLLLRRGGQRNPALLSDEMEAMGLRSISGTGGLEWFVPRGDTTVLERVIGRYPPRDIEMAGYTPPTPPDDDPDGGGTPPITPTPTPTPTPSGTITELSEVPDDAKEHLRTTEIRGPFERDDGTIRFRMGNEMVADVDNTKMDLGTTTAGTAVFTPMRLVKEISADSTAEPIDHVRQFVSEIVGTPEPTLPPAPSTPAGGGQPATADTDRNNQIERIREYRDTHGVSLRVAKEAIESGAVVGEYPDTVNTPKLEALYNSLDQTGVAIPPTVKGNIAVELQKAILEARYDDWVGHMIKERGVRNAIQKVIDEAKYTRLNADTILEVAKQHYPTSVEETTEETPEQANLRLLGIDPDAYTGTDTQKWELINEAASGPSYNGLTDEQFSIRNRAEKALRQRLDPQKDIDGISYEDRIAGGHIGVDIKPSATPTPTEAGVSNLAEWANGQIRTGKRPEDVIEAAMGQVDFAGDRDEIRWQLINEINKEGMSSGRRGFVMLPNPKPQETPDGDEETVRGTDETPDRSDTGDVGTTQETPGSETPSQPTDRTTDDRDATGTDSSEAVVKQGILDAFDQEDFTLRGNKFTVDVEGVGSVEVSVGTRWTSSIDAVEGGGMGMSAPEYSSSLYIRSNERPVPFTSIIVEVPQAVSDKHNAVLEEKVLSHMRNVDNWERIGRKNAFKHTNGTEVSIKRSPYSSGYKAEFTKFPQGLSSGFTAPRVDGTNLAERLSDALTQLDPHTFSYNDFGRIVDTLRAESEPETTETPDLTPHLTLLGIDPALYTEMTLDQKHTAIGEAYDDAMDADADVPQDKREALNALQAAAREEEAGTFSDVTTADSTENITRILGNMDASPTKARVQGVQDHVKKGLPLKLIGHSVKSAEEAAVLGQLVRDPQIETTWIVYRKNGRVLKVEPHTLNRAGGTPTGSLSAIKKQLKKLQADDFVRIHNHPTAIARFSNHDLRKIKEWREYFGEQLAEEIVVDSGTYASMDFDENGTPIPNNEIQLPSEAVGWDTSVAPVDTSFDPERSDGIREGDPLYQNPLMRGARTVAQFGMNLKHKKDWTTVFAVDSDGDVADIEEIKKATLKQLLSLAKTHNQAGGEIHITMGDLRGAAREVLKQLATATGVGSVWADGERVGATAVDTGEAITRNIGGGEQRFVAYNPDTLSDPLAPSLKNVVIASISHTLGRDTRRESKFEGIESYRKDMKNRRGQFPQDAEHVTGVFYNERQKKEIYDQASKQGVLTSKRRAPGTPGSFEQSHVFFSPGQLFRGDPGDPTYGFILNGEEMIKQGVAKIRIDYGKILEGEQALAWMKSPEAIDTSYELIVPDQVDVNPFLIGVIEESKVFIRLDLAQVSIEGLEAYQTEADLAGQPRSDEGELSDVITDARETLNPQSSLLQMLGVKSRQTARITRNAFESGFGMLEEMKAKDGESPQIGDTLYEDVLEMGNIFQNEFGKEDHEFDALYKEFDTFIRKRATPGIIDRVDPQKRGLRKQTRAEASDKVWRFIEDGTAITGDAELTDFAKRFKEMWRGLQVKGVNAMLEKQKEVKESHDEDIFITDSAGNRVAWFPESFDGFVWDRAGEVFVKGDQQYSIEDAHAQANKLYTPHYFKHHVLRQEHAKVSKLLNAMTKLEGADNPTKLEGTLKQLNLIKTAEGYRFGITGETFPDIQDAIVSVKDYLSQRDQYFREMLEYHDAGLRSERRGQDGGDGIGHYGQLERARETQDKFYERNIGLLKETRRLMWHRFAEISAIGQTHPFDGNSPRLEQRISEVRGYRGNVRERALDAVAKALRAGQPDSMFERLPEFARGVDEGLQIQQDWKVYERREVTDPKTGAKSIERFKTDRYNELDIDRMNLPPKTLETLEHAGMLTKVGDSYKVAGETVADRQLTLARFFYEYYNTISRRENTVRQLFMSLGHWDSRNPLEMDEGQFFQKLNDVITLTTIGYPTSALNIVEGIGGLPQDIGTANMIKGINTMVNKEKRDQLMQLSSAMSNTPRFLADTSLGEKYFTSGWTFFTLTDKMSRAFGLTSGIENAKDLIQKYASADSEKSKAKWRRSMQAMNLNTNVVDAAIASGNLPSQLKSAEDAIYAGEVDMTGTPEAQATLAHAILRSGRFVSNETFKRYDATSLPPFLLKHSPLLRVFTKYKSWSFQQNRQQYKRFKNIKSEMRRGNFSPFSNMLQGAAIFGTTYAMMNLLWASGREEEQGMMERFGEGMLDAQMFGLASVMLQMALRADGNWFRMQKDMVSQLAGPAASITSGIIAPIVTGDFVQAGEQALYRVPGVNVAKRASGLRLTEIFEDEE